MSGTRMFACLVLCVVLAVSSSTVSASASGNLVSCAAPSYADWSRLQEDWDWEDWEDFWKEWFSGNGWPAWFYLWGWFWGFRPPWLYESNENGIPVWWSNWPYNYNDEIDDYNLYFGQLNAHTSLSDGKGSLSEAYRHARDVAKLDFFAVTDDSGMFDNASKASLSDGSASSEWKNGKATADAYTDKNFVAIFGYEMAWNNGNGHISTFNTDGFENPNKPEFKGTKGLANYYNALKKHSASISQFNHPGKEYGDFNNFGYYDKDIDALISLIEVGNGEGAVGSDKYYRAYDYYTKALDKGWHLAPTNNQDNRGKAFGDANTARTVVLAKKLTRDDLYDAMRNRRVYATEDENLEIRYTLDGKIMGSTVKTSADNVRIRVKLKESGGETIGKVSVITHGGEVVTSQTLAVQSHTLDLALPSDRPYYYIRVDQFDKDIAVTAPVWIERVKTNNNDKPGSNKGGKNAGPNKDTGKKDKAVENVCDLIDKIYAGRSISDAAVKKARDAYNKLSEAQKKQVDNYYKLVAAEKWREWEKLWENTAGIRVPNRLRIKNNFSFIYSSLKTLPCYLKVEFGYLV